MGYACRFNDTNQKARRKIYLSRRLLLYSGCGCGSQRQQIRIIQDLDGKVVAATTTSTYELYLKKDLTIDAEGVPPFEYQLNPGTIRSLDNVNTALDDLRLGDGVRLDAVVGSLPSFVEAQKNGYPIRVLGDPVFYEPLSVAIENGDDDLAKKISEAVAAMKADGTLSKLSVKWYGVDYSKSN